MIRALLPLLLLVGCEPAKDAPVDIFTDQTDADDDGFIVGEDCDDENASVNPDAEERCDARDEDEDCSGASDNDDPNVVDGFVMYPDADGDGWGDEAAPTTVCEPIDGYVARGGDCDDTDGAVSPVGVEVCDAGLVDEDCNGVANDDDPGVLATGLISAWPDGDGDGFGAGIETGFCEVPDGWVLDDTDCDDELDFVYPSAAEVCDGIDDDCDGLSDENDALDVGTYYADLDGDGFGDADNSRIACDEPEGFVTDDTDCDDRAIGVYPGASEFCDGEDDDCDGTVDEDDAVDVVTWYEDADRDGYGDSTSTTDDCDQPSGYVATSTDCDDTSSNVSPAKTEVCDSADTDEDCDGVADDDDSSVSSTGATRYYADDDGDGYGDASDSDYYCDSVSGLVTNDDDCDDTDSSISPAGSEVCDAADTDEDCDGFADDDDRSVSSSGKSTYYLDADGDGYGTSSSSTSLCDLATGYSTNSTDCDDSKASRSPGNPEVCDSADTDEDCDSLADDNDSSTSAATKTTFYVDADGDGYGTSSSTASRCDTTTGYAAVSGDCDETDSDVNPGEEEVCFDSVDDNCDGATDCNGTADDANRRLLGEAAGDEFGTSVANAYDTNNDGIDDIIVGAPNNDRGATDAGAAYVFYTAATGDLSAGGADAILVGEDTSDAFGYAVAGIGDINSDSRDDMIVGAPYDDDGGTTAGIVYLFRGRMSGTTDASLAYAEYVGESASDQAGKALAAAGDVSGNGVPDFVIGAPGRSSNTGGVYLITSVSSGTTDLSIATAIMTGESSSDSAGASVDGAGDVNADGYDDFVVGAVGDDDTANNAGAAYLVLGPQTGTSSLSTADAKRRGTAAADVAGSFVAGAGDLNADGYDDLIIGSYGYGTYGAVFVELGPITGAATLSGADARIDGVTGTFGEAGAGDGDLDGDGYDDIVIGDADNDSSTTDAGAVFAFLGPLTGTLDVGDADILVTGGATTDYFGLSVSLIGAQDGSAGFSDFLVGGYWQDTAGTNAGAAYTFSATGF